MKLGTLRTSAATIAVRIDGESATEITGVADVGALLADPDWQAVASAASGQQHQLDSIEP